MPLPAADLRAHLGDRYERLQATDPANWPDEARKMGAWLRTEPLLRPLVSEIDASSFDVEAWHAAPHPASRGMGFPESEAARAKLCLALLEAADPYPYRNIVGGDTSIDPAHRFGHTVVRPLVDYLKDRVEEGEATLSLLKRYRRRCEWFGRERLHALYQSDTRHGEERLDADLREYLVDQGVPFPFSQPKSPSGEVDIVAYDGDERMTIEVKLFLGTGSRSRAYVRKGFSQARRYARDYDQPYGYLVVFNLSPKLLVFEGDVPGRDPASIAAEDRTVFCLAIDVTPDRPSASRDPRLARVVLNRDYLLGS